MSSVLEKKSIVFASCYVKYQQPFKIPVVNTANKCKLSSQWWIRSHFCTLNSLCIHLIRVCSTWHSITCNSFFITPIRFQKRQDWHKLCNVETLPLLLLRSVHSRKKIFYKLTFHFFIFHYFQTLQFRYDTYLTNTKY